MQSPSPLAVGTTCRKKRCSTSRSVSADRCSLTSWLALVRPASSVAAYSLRAARSTEYFTFASTMGLPLAPSAGGAIFCSLALGATLVPTERLRFASLVGGTSGGGEGA